MKKIKIGILISGSGTNMQAIVKSCERGEVSGEVVFVGSDNLEAKGLAWARKEKGIPTFTVNYQEIRKKIKEGVADVPHNETIYGVIKKSSFLAKKFPGDIKKKIEYLQCKIAAEQSLLMCMKEYKFDLLVLAGFMQVCTSFLIDGINTNPEKPRIVNIHPALLPSFPGVSGYEDTYNYGCKIGGCTVHFVDYGEDTGPIIGQRAVSILTGDSLVDFKKKGLNKEYELYPECIQLFAENRLKVVTSPSGRKIVKIKKA